MRRPTSPNRKSIVITLWLKSEMCNLPFLLISGINKKRLQGMFQELLLPIEYNVLFLLMEMFFYDLYLRD